MMVEGIKSWKYFLGMCPTTSVPLHNVQNHHNLHRGGFVHLSDNTALLFQI